MENTDDKYKKKNGLTKSVDITTEKWEKNITSLDLSDKRINEMGENIKLPDNLIELNLSHNLLKEVPSAVLKLKNLQKLNISYNRIIYFDDTPDFCHTIVYLDISNNTLNGPPYWVWSNTPKNMRKLNLSYNPNLTISLTDEYLQELMQYKTLVTDVDISNCRVRNNTNVLKLFESTRTLTAGVSDFTYSNKNNLVELPNIGLENYCDIEQLYICNTNIYIIKSNIDIYKKLMVVDLSMNNITDFPKEFCNLHNLEVCILSFNKILYLPDEIHKLEKLRELHLNTNELCMVPESITKLYNLKLLDLYDNHISKVPEEIETIEKLDLALNYFDEPTNDIYVTRKANLRLKLDRMDGRKKIMEVSESETSSFTAEENDLTELEDFKEDNIKENGDASSSEDWDSDEYWIPRYYKLPSPPTSQWLCYIKEKMEEGNFCPMDMHTPSVTDRINEEWKSYPKEEYESDGQFDDYSDDDS